jgi:hypothetical protein
MESRYIAAHPVRWGDRLIEVGEPVPEGDQHRDYLGMVRRGELLDKRSPGHAGIDKAAFDDLAARVDALAAKLDRVLDAVGDGRGGARGADHARGAPSRGRE